MKTVTRIPVGVEIVSGDPTAPNGFRRRLNVLVEFKNNAFWEEEAGGLND